MEKSIMWLMVVLAVSISASAVESKYIAYNTTSSIVKGKLNVHLVAHTHDDVGWLKTVDQYYSGANNSIDSSCVQNILDSVVHSLLADKNRKFIYVEQAFFQRWWNEQSERVKKIVKGLLGSGQLEFINGGMCMHDEATTHYIDMIDQTAMGHHFIKQEFNVTPRIGWQIDPFGHSSVQSYLLGTEVGFDSVYFGRIDYQDFAKRQDHKSLEMVWQGSKSFGSSSQIFAGALVRGYGPPDGYSFEVDSESDTAIIQDDMSLFDYNVPKRVDEFVALAMTQADLTRTNHIMWTMGTDFTYQYAESWFREMDKFIHYVNQDGRVNVLYSTPSVYTDAKHAANESWPLKTEDFFPYADLENGYWTGYYTSRAAVKGYVRSLSGYYLAARQLEFYTGRNNTGPNTDYLGEALAIAQHHDAVSGTEKQHVANDYSQRLSIGYNQAELMVGSSLSYITDLKPKTGNMNPSNKFQQCPLVNISYCPASEVDLSTGKDLVVVAYNPLGWKRVEVIRIPVVNANVTVKDSQGKEVESQLMPFMNHSVSLRNYYSMAYLAISPNVTPSYWLAFSASVPPLGFTTFTIFMASSSAAHQRVAEKTVYRAGASQRNTVMIGPGDLKLVYSGKEGRLTQYRNTRSLVRESMEQSYSYYGSYVGTNDDNNFIQGSGAYIFRPNGTYAINPQGKVEFTVLRGTLVDEVHQKINPWIHQITRLYKQKEHVEVEFTIGPIPIDDGVGKEVVTKLTTSIESNKTFYTDSNGRDFLERIRDYRKDWNLTVNQPIAGNYYPINLGMYMKDNDSELSILVDRAVGGSSLVDGQFELMLHRRLLYDDARGVGEPLNETVCVHDECTGLKIVGKYYYRIDPVSQGAKWRRSFGQEIYSPLLLAFSEQDGESWANTHVTTFSGMDPSYVLPDNVAIITLQELDDGNVLLRLAHLYEIGEDKEMSAMASVELKRVFPQKKIKGAREMSLSGNQGRDEMEQKKLAWKLEGVSSEANEAAAAMKGGPIDGEKLVVELAPMQIRTFILDLD